MSFDERFQQMLLSMVPFLLAIVFHEVGHAVVAKKFGDTTAEDMGRLTLNPIPHIDPIGTILFPMLNMLSGINILFGWAKPVPINFNKLKPYRKGLFLTALGGPGANVILAFILGLFVVLFTQYVSQDFYLFKPLVIMAKIGIQINYALCVFNLIPLPPLDGSKMVEAFLSYNATKQYEKIQSYSFLILMALLWTGALNILYYPVVYLSALSEDVWVKLFF